MDSCSVIKLRQLYECKMIKVMFPAIIKMEANINHLRQLFYKSENYKNN